MVDYIRDKIDNQHFVGGIFLYLEKAFDKVNHDILLNKLEFYGVKGISLQLLKSYLSNRFQQVSFDNFCSTFLDIMCGVPQGSMLGLFYFLSTLMTCTKQ